MEQIHGYKPGTANPTTQLVLSHKHPEDLDHVATTLDDIRRTHKPFCARHRIITVHGATREVVVIGECLYDAHNEIVGTQGFYIDVTPSGPVQRAALTQAVAEFAENRAIIEQAKGLSMFVYHIEAEAAFDLLKWRSQNSNVKLRALAEQLLSDARNMRYGEELPHRSEFDMLLHTARERVHAKAHGEPGDAPQD